MILKQLSEELAKYNVDGWIAERLLVYGEQPFVRWMVCKHVDGKNIYASFTALSAWIGVTVDRIRNIYYAKERVKGYNEVWSHPGYSAIISALLEAHPDKDLWDELLRYGFDQIRRFAVELVVLKRGHDMRKVCDEFKISQSLAYLIRRTASKRFIEMYEDGTEFI